MVAFSQIVLIYNPNSTGSSYQKAQRLLKDIQERLPDQPVVLKPTEYAKHAEELAYETAIKYDEPLILSSSGDGGYHEVVNGIMRAYGEGRAAVAGLIPAGNANDHFHATQDNHSLIDCIVSQNVKVIDLLKFESTTDQQTITRYGHSYIGLGITPQVGKKLNKTKINPINQYLIAARILLRSKPVNLRLKGKVDRYDSLILSNIDRMSRLLTLSRNAQIDDGKFEVTVVKERPKWQLIKLIFKAASIGLDGSWQSNEFNFETVEATEVQIDGEIYALDSNAKVFVSISQQSLKRLM